MSENSDELIIDPQLLAQIQRQCRRRAAELAATGALQQSPAAPGSSQSVFGVANVPPPVPATLTEAERFAAAIPGMPSRVRAFFEHNDPVPPRHWESDQDRAQRERLADLGRWAGG